MFTCQHKTVKITEKAVRFKSKGGNVNGVEKSHINYPYVSKYVIKALLKTNSMVETRVHLDQFSLSYGLHITVQFCEKNKLLIIKFSQKNMDDFRHYSIEICQYPNMLTFRI